MRAIFNTPEVHNLVVCTLCSCYPWAVLGLPPVWYKSPAYRSRAVIDPRSVPAEFGVDLPAERRYGYGIQPQNCGIWSYRSGRLELKVYPRRRSLLLSAAMQ